MRVEQREGGGAGGGVLNGNRIVAIILTMRMIHKYIPWIKIYKNGWKTKTQTSSISVTRENDGEPPSPEGARHTQLRNEGAEPGAWRAARPRRAPAADVRASLPGERALFHAEARSLRRLVPFYLVAGCRPFTVSIEKEKALCPTS